MDSPRTPPGLGTLVVAGGAGIVSRVRGRAGTRSCTEAGQGDFYDAFELPDGSLVVVIGDVQGHSLRAASVMVELRLSLRAYLLEGHPREDWAVVLVTDGLLERRSGDIRQALGAMADVVADAGTLHPEQLCDLLLNRFDISDREDDVAVLVVRRTVAQASTA